MDEIRCGFGRGCCACSSLLRRLGRSGRSSESLRKSKVNMRPRSRRPRLCSIDGDIDGAEKLLVGLTEADGSAAMSLLVGDALYNTDPIVSYKLHKKAYDAMPDERTTVLEWAMERHRKQECGEAVPLYKKYLKVVPDDRRLNALLADCLIREGKPREAVAAWEAAAYPRNHTAIDFGICEIYGDLSPPKRRGDLLKQIRQGKLELIEPLFALDLDFDRDWWNGGVDQQALDRDLPFVERLLGKDSKRVQAIRCWLSIATRDDPQADFVTAQLKQFGLIVDGGEQPKNSLVAGRLLGRVVDLKIETPDRLFARFHDELLTRAKSKAGDVEALNILCNLCEDQKQRRRIRAISRGTLRRSSICRRTVCSVDGRSQT